MTRPVVVLGAVVATLAVALGTADATAGRARPPASAVTAGSVTTVQQATVVCPDVRGTTSGQVTWVRAQGVGDGIVNGAAQITATVVTGHPAEFAPAAAALGLIPYGLAYGGRVDSGTQAMALTATGPSAVGLSAIEVTRATTGLSRGIEATSCAAPGTEFTFSGGSTVTGNQLKLILTNIDASPAEVDVNLIGPHGPVNTPGTDGLQVPAHTRIGIDLVKLGPGEAALTTMVTSVTGRIAAAEVTSRRNGDTARGVDYIPDAGPASRRSLVPGIMAEADKRTLVLTDPGTSAANVTVQVVSDTGTFTPVDLETVTVNPGALTTVDLTAALAGHPGALLVTSDQPVVAAASQELGSTTSPDTDVSWTAQTPTLNGPAVLPVVPLDTATGRDVWLYLTAVHAAGTVTITPTGPLDTTQSTFPPAVQVSVPAGRTVTADLATLLGASAGDLTVRVSADPAGGAVTGSAVFRESTPNGLMAGQVGLVTVPGVIILPTVHQDPTASGARPGEIVPSTAP